MNVPDQFDAAMKIVADEAVAVDRDAVFPTRSVKAIGDAGLFGLTLPLDAGGLGGGPEEFLQVTNEIARRCSSTAMIYVMHICGTQTLASASPNAPALKQIANGEHLTTLAFSERGSRSHFWAPVSRLDVQKTRTRLRAEKSFVTSAGHAQSYVTSVGLGGETGLESDLYLIPSDADGVTVGAAWSGLGLRGNASASMTFDTEVTNDDRLGDEGGGLNLMLGVVLPWFQLGASAVSLGIAAAAASATVAHITGARLEHASVTLSDLPVVRNRMGRMQAQVDALGGFLSDVARRMAQGDQAVPILSSKARANEVALEVTQEAMQACGGAAMSATLPLERHLRDARAGSVMAPTTDVLFELIGRAAVGLPLL